MKDFFNTEITRAPIRINIYADEIQGKRCPYTNEYWNYMGLLIENLDSPLLDDIILERFKGNLDQESPYFEKNNKQVHWCEIRTADTKNICKRWFEYILDPARSESRFNSYILGLNDTHLSKEEFDSEDEFSSKYNRFFRSAIFYAIKNYFGNDKVIIENIYHEKGQQQNNSYFPWHTIYKLKGYENISLNCTKIEFLSKDHRMDQRSNLIQLCDCVLGASTSILHGIEHSKKSYLREELIDLYSPLFNFDLRLRPQPESSYLPLTRPL